MEAQQYSPTLASLDRFKNFLFIIVTPICVHAFFFWLDTINLGCSIVYIEGSQVIISK